MKKNMTIKEAYEWINNDCMAAIAAGTSTDEWAAADETTRMKIAEEYVNWFNDCFA